MRATRVTTPSTTLVDAAPALARARARRTAPGPRRPHRAGARARAAAACGIVCGRASPFLSACMVRDARLVLALDRAAANDARVESSRASRGARARAQCARARSKT
jgi:hypothetical protein